VGAFPAATVTSRDVVRQFGVRALGEVDGARESYFAVTVERRIRHAAVVAICERARRVLRS
jgi:LysR family transcriptional activator of nhaA